MAYNEENLAKLKALKQLAERITEGYATKKSVEDLETKVEGLVTAGGEPNVITAVKVNGDALPVTDKAVDVGASIAAAVAAADHLKRVKVDSVDDIDPAADGADKYIYMAPKADSEEGDLYDEYMVLDGAVEHVGSTKVDLSGYVPAEEGKGLSSNDYTDEEKAKLAGLKIATDTEVLEMLDEVFGASASRNFSEIYGLELTSEETEVTFTLPGLSPSLYLDNESTIFGVAEDLNRTISYFGMTASVDSSTGYLAITDDESGEEISYTIKINDEVVYPLS